MVEFRENTVFSGEQTSIGFYVSIEMWLLSCACINFQQVQQTDKNFYISTGRAAYLLCCQSLLHEQMPVIPR